MEIQTQRKPRFLCLHGFRTSADILEKQLRRWPEVVLGRLDLVFLDAPYPSRGKSTSKASTILRTMSGSSLARIMRSSIILKNVLLSLRNIWSNTGLLMGFWVFPRLRGGAAEEGHLGDLGIGERKDEEIEEGK
ncbi:alpha/beta-Hydrolases superfamily protein [Actinidia rufa]|uniref:Alpha/beta-Hydrolases superfamily protein n=1 Tax=Actinidia rufa TaxID=165716 RepID=A0A7J0EM22_9ERIC|nr:alpha/beta-Hydrolases superfamily protein [Actinidia rufa]